MRVAVVGVGGMGGYFGGLLARGGADVTLIARGAHLAAMRERGLTVRSELYGEFTVPVRATDDPIEVGAVDLVLFCVKGYDLEAGARLSAPLVGPETTVIPVQNGIDIVERLEGIFGEGRVLGGMTYVGGKIEAPGVVAQGGAMGELIFGELAGGMSERTEQIADFLRDSGIGVELLSDIRSRLWEKFTVICATGGVLAVARLPFGAVFASPEASELMRGVMGEVENLARASNAGLAEGTAERLFDFLKANMDPEGRSSQLQDLEAGRRLELEFLNGTAVRLGRELGVPTPLNFAIYAALKPHVDGPVD